MRTRVFDHIQKMPIAFFTRTQTGALVSRLNNDVLGAQQAFTDTFSSVVSNVDRGGHHPGGHVLAVVADHARGAGCCCRSSWCRPGSWASAWPTITRESYTLNAQMTNTMTERFNVAGALLVKLFGHQRDEVEGFSDKAGRVRDIGVTQAMYTRVFMAALLLTASLATALVYGWGGVLAERGVLMVGTLVALTAYLTRLYGPLDRAVERAGRRHDGPGLVRPGVRGPRPAAHDRRQARRRRHPARPRSRRVRPRRLRLPERRGGVAGIARVGRRPRAHRVAAGALRRVVPGPARASSWPWSGRRGPGRRPSATWCRGCTTCASGAVRINGVDVRDATLESIGEIVGVVTQDAHLFHETIRANLRYAKPDATDDELVEALRAADILPLVESLPDGLDTLVGDRGYRLSGGEKQRIAIARLLLKAPDIVVLDEATAHLDSESEVAVQQALKTALAGRTSLVIAHRLSTVREADVILVVEEGRIVERGRHDELLAAGGLYSELYTTQFEPQADPRRGRVANGGGAATPAVVTGRRRAHPSAETAVRDPDTGTGTGGGGPV